jgi:lipoprotein-releasing system permease protein
MYHAQLTNRYLTSRVIPLVAVAAVALCVALVIIVVSVMTGFLEMVKNSGRTLMGDVVVSHAVSGIPHYQALIRRLEQAPEVAAATPVVDTWGLLRMPYPDGPKKEVHTVQVWGIEPASFNRVTGFARTLYWRPMSPEEERQARPDDFRRRLGPERLKQALDQGTSLSGGDVPGMDAGMHVSIGNQRQSDGSYEPRRDGYWFLPDFQVTLTVLPVVGEGFTQPRSRIFQVTNEFLSGVFLIDKSRVMIPLDVAQDMLHMNAATIVDDEDRVLGEDPARATMILVRAAEGVTPAALRLRVADAYQDFCEALLADESVLVKPPLPGMGVSVQTWQEQQREFIAPVEKERELMRTLFSLVYLVCAGLVLAIFWAIVYEKTRDIGILRSLGASRLGISWIFLRYGLVIGVAGAVAGLGLGTLVVHQINAIHAALGNPPLWLAVVLFAAALLTMGAAAARARSGRMLPLVVGALLTLVLAGFGAVILLVKRGGGVVIWDPAVYYFSVIPNQVDYGSALVTMVGAVVFSLLGAFLPAAKAADTDPVQSLRYE